MEYGPGARGYRDRASRTEQAEVPARALACGSYMALVG
jgi:hypothetical protein